MGTTASIVGYGLFVGGMVAFLYTFVRASFNRRPGLGGLVNAADPDNYTEVGRRYLIWSYAIFVGAWPYALFILPLFDIPA